MPIFKCFVIGCGAPHS